MKMAFNRKIIVFNALYKEKISINYAKDLLKMSYPELMKEYKKYIKKRRNENV